jgi:UDP-2,3-diacylglucosamine hydrolase
VRAEARLSAPLGVIAGGGDLPRRLIERVVADGRRVFVLGVAGFVDPQLLLDFPGAQVSIGEIGRQMDLLRREGCAELVFAGVVKRPDFSQLKLDVKGALLLPKVLAAARQGDDALLRIVVQTFEAAGFNVLGAETVVGALAAPAGAIGSLSPADGDWLDIRTAARAAAAIGALDIGQGAVSCDGVVLALEAQEGTDLMLRRCAELPAALRGAPGARRGVLVKRPKPGQERRIDLPTIGEATVRGAAAAGLAGIAVEAGAALVLNREAVAALADELGLFIHGFRPGEVD